MLPQDASLYLNCVDEITTTSYTKIASMQL